MKNNILKVWEDTTDLQRHDWYKEANSFSKNLSVVFNTHHFKTAGIIAALSPLKSWKQNKQLAKDFLLTFDAGHTSANIEKARKILYASGPAEVANILKGPKVTAFYYNILDPEKDTFITIDRHALSIAVGYKMSDLEISAVTRNQNKFFQDCYKYAAGIIGVSPLLLQSATWLNWRERKPGKRKRHTFKNSSNLLAAGYDPEQSRLNVTFQSGDKYTYIGVPESKYKKLVRAENSGGSAGKFFAKEIRNNYKFLRL